MTSHILQGDCSIPCPLCNRVSPLALTGQEPGIYDLRCGRCKGVFTVQVKDDFEHRILEPPTPIEA